MLYPDFPSGLPLHPLSVIPSPSMIPIIWKTDWCQLCQFVNVFFHYPPNSAPTSLADGGSWKAQHWVTFSGSWVYKGKNWHKNLDLVPSQPYLLRLTCCSFLSHHCTVGIALLPSFVLRLKCGSARAWLSDHVQHRRCWFYNQPSTKENEWNLSSILY